MKENNTAEGTGFFLSPADIDRINKDKNTGNDEADWFSGVTNAGGENAGGETAFSPLDFAAKIITEDVSANNKKVKEASEPEEVEEEPDAAESVSAIESELITEKPESEPEQEPEPEQEGGEAEEIEEESESNTEPEPESEPELITEKAATEPEHEPEPFAVKPEPETKPESVPAKTIIYERSAIDAAISAQAKPIEAAANPADLAYGRAGGRSDNASSGNDSSGSRAFKADTQAEIAAKEAEAEKKAAEKKAAEEKAAARAAKEAELAAKKAEEAEKRAAARAARQAEIAAKKAEKAEWKEEKKRQRKAYKGEGPAHRAAAVLLGLLLVVSAVAALLYWIGITSFQKEYVAGNSNAVQVYIAAEDLEDGAGTIAAEENADAKTDAEAGSGEDKNAGKNADAEEALNAKADEEADANGESGKKADTVTADSGDILVDAGTLVRGTEVSRYKISESLNGEKLCKIKINDPENPDADTNYYISEDNLTDDYESIVQETEVWVRTPATIYEREYGPSIASFAPKGMRLRVVGFDKLLDNGYINKYKVEYDPVDTKEEDTATGYVYGKYMAATKDEAEAPYNEHGETDKAKKEKFGFELYGGKGENLDWYPYEKTSIPGNKFCKKARAMYINTYAAVHPGSWVKLINKTDCNAVVIDLKDGPLTFAAETAKELSPTSYKNAYVSEEKLREGIEKYRETGVYLIGRIVVFNDKNYAKDHPEDCIKYGSDTSWPSAYSRDVWEYNVRLAQEAVEKFGFNEIQFDYVRFPETSYEMSKSGKANFRNKYDEEKAQAVQNFCFYACDQLRESGAYTSVDVFGESAYSYVTAYGQYWASISNIVDAISAMPYTDHFSGEEPWEHPYDSVKKWAKSAAKRQKRIQNPAAARTWITGYNTPYWKPTVNYGTKEMRAQIRALEDVGLKGGFIPWNVMSDLEKYNQYRTIWNKK